MTRKHKARAPELNFGRPEDFRLVGGQTVDGAEIEHETRENEIGRAFLAELEREQQVGIDF